MATAAEQLADYVYVYSIALLPGVAEDEFERHILHEVFPHFNVTHRPIGAVNLAHSLLKRGDGAHAERYVWEIRVRFFVRISGVPDEAALTKLDELVRAALSGIGNPVTVTILHEVGAAQTQ